MGNTDSHSSVVSAAKPSLGFSSRKEEVPSARSWWRSSQGGCRSRGRSYPNHQNATWHYERGPKAARGGSRPRAGSAPQRYSRGEPFGYVGSGGGICDGRASLKSGGSPKVMLSKDGSMRVEFTNARVVPVEPQTLSTTTSGTAGPEPSLRTSKGSSLSSDGSWYDSPWGNGGELTDSVFMCSQNVDSSSGYTTYSSTRTEETATSSSGYNTFFSTHDGSPAFASGLLFPTAETGVFTSATGYNTCSSGRTEDSGIGDSVILQSDLPDFSLVSPSSVYSSHSTLAAFPTEPHTCLLPRSASSSSSSPQVDDVIQEETGLDGGMEQRYSSYTLPCRKAEAANASSNNRKDFLKSRIQRLSDWTGSLSRKKRRIQEPYGSDDVFNGLNSGPVSCSTLWSQNPLHTLNQNHVPQVHCASSRSLNQSSDAQRLNIYENFMQELETGCSSTAYQTELSEGEEDQDEEDMDGDVEMGAGGGELDVLFEKEQGAVRRAGWLSFKALITVNKDRKLELVARRKWRHCWVTLKGCTLLFYETYGRSSAGAEQELAPRYALLTTDSIVQAVPEHPRREHVFCLSNSHGDVYLFQATNQTDLENWATAIHSASASLLAKRQGKEDTLRLLRCQSRSLLHKIDMDGKMKKMAELQLSVIREPKNRKAVESQIQQWEQNLERLNLDLFRLRCYLSSLQGSELPNPKSLLAVASRPSKSTLGRLGVFSVSSFHALVCSRGGATLRRRRQSAGSSRRTRGLPSSLKALGGLSRRSRDSRHSATQNLDCVSKQREVAPSAGHAAALQKSDPEMTLCVQLCEEPSTGSVFTLHICRPDAEPDFGFAVTGHVDGAGKSHVFISEVNLLGQSAREGLRAGDEVLAVNGASVSGLDLDLMQSVFGHQRLHLLLRRPDPQEPANFWPDPSGPADPADPGDPCCQLLLSTQTCSPDSSLISDTADRVQTPDDTSTRSPEDTEPPQQNVEHVCSLYQTFPEAPTSDPAVPKNPYSREAGPQPASPAHLSMCQRLRKVIQELVDTEKSYVKDLVCLFTIYLTPLQKETFLSTDEMEALFGSLPEMLDFQKVFLQTLEERIAACPNFSRLETPEQFQKLLFSLGGSFLYYADHFKLYSGFCANHIKVQKVLERAKTDAAFKHFLEARNPTNQHSSSLESYLIKPVQRVLKYPLLLRELVSLTDPESPEHTHLTEALRAMEKVATHINEMQKIYEDYGCVFDQLAAEQSRPHRQVTEISMGEFLVHSSVLWLNPLPSLGRLRKEPELTLFVFKRVVILVYRDSSRVKKRTTGTRSADLDPFRFRWLIPVSAVQVRPANIAGSEDPCVWELVHSRSEVEGRPETVFQLCSSGLETKASVLRALRSLLRERAPSGSLRTKLSTAERRRQQRCKRTTTRPPDDGCRHDGVLGDTCSEPLLPSRTSAGPAGRRSRLCSLTGELEAQLQRLHFSEEEAERGASSRSSSLRRSPGDLLDLSGLLERDFSVQSMTSMINEDCFYEAMLGLQTPPVPGLQG
ncbi:T-lymphoma invasion and metastasis-inducing protein 2 [Parambassis ranga]|uniref:T-lymphoma invasion and metastasis-inducing protein 2-like n=1 Tax=Parambassis ranga TaxID=210632 RepID=A0A6P7HPS3_9TELE|nr:T-lymphoma invasion and metastasis-inducing protein 2-like [Parambassis ranga]XP_028252590.1 T-lymphoma invasion and metastasis-inducing protein 2-like [Parambassis ranga]XP_028252591.1 T-lymphoma invasion and metastasis-inducing protein 2-like [Parambassis ranga]XP_028252592.1 T-lymphoma invasion and metastasis-inducing protein 2-like [Parambassis ranga]